MGIISPIFRGLKRFKNEKSFERDDLGFDFFFAPKSLLLPPESKHASPTPFHPLSSSVSLRHLPLPSGAWSSSDGPRQTPSADGPSLPAGPLGGG